MHAKMQKRRATVCVQKIGPPVTNWTIHFWCKLLSSATTSKNQQTHQFGSAQPSLNCPPHHSRCLMDTEKPKQQQTAQPRCPEKQIGICHDGQCAPSHMAAHFANRLDHHLALLEYGLAPIHILILLLLLDTALSLSKGTLTLNLLLQLCLLNANPRRSQLCKEARGLRCTIPSVLGSTYCPTAQRHLVLWGGL